MPRRVIPRGVRKNVPVVFEIDTLPTDTDVLYSDRSGKTYAFGDQLVDTHHNIHVTTAFQLCKVSRSLFKLGEKVVIKVWDRKIFYSGEKPQTELATIQLLSAVGDLHFNRLLDFCQDSEYIYMVTPYMPGGNMYQRILARNEPMSEDEARPILLGLMTHLSFMKDYGIAHRYVSFHNLGFCVGSTRTNW